MACRLLVETKFNTHSSRVKIWLDVSTAWEVFKWFSLSIMWKCKKWVFRCSHWTTKHYYSLKYCIKFQARNGNDCTLKCYSLSLWFLFFLHIFLHYLNMNNYYLYNQRCENSVGDDTPNWIGVSNALLLSFSTVKKRTKTHSKHHSSTSLLTVVVQVLQVPSRECAEWCVWFSNWLRIMNL